MAATVGISPSDLIAVGRSDAAAELRALLSARDESGAVDLTNVDSDDLLDELRRRLRGNAATIPELPTLAAARKLDPNDPSAFYRE